jgi:hypothetical protein
MIRQTLNRAALLAALFFITGCQSESTVGLVLEPGNRAFITVEGDNPFVTVHNDGPGTLHVAFRPGEMLNSEHNIGPGAASGQNMPKGGEISIVNDSDKRATAEIAIRNHDGIDVKQGPQSKPPSDR